MNITVEDENGIEHTFDIPDDAWVSESKLNDLLDCPFCGEKPEVTDGIGGKVVYCMGPDENCGHRGIMMTYVQWQKRAI